MNDAAKDRPHEFRNAAGQGVGGEPARNPSPHRTTDGSLLSRFRWGCLVACNVVFAGVAFAAADDAKIIFPAGAPKTGAPAVSAPATGAGGYTLVVALLLAAVGAWFYWRNRKAPGLGRGAQNLAIEETKSLGNRQYLVVASYGEEKFLLGVCPGRIDMLTPVGRHGAGEHSP